MPTSKASVTRRILASLTKETMTGHLLQLLDMFKSSFFLSTPLPGLANAR